MIGAMMSPRWPFAAEDDRQRRVADVGVIGDGEPWTSSGPLTHVRQEREGDEVEHDRGDDLVGARRTP